MVRRMMITLLVGHFLVLGACGTATPIAPPGPAPAAPELLSAEQALARVEAAIRALPEVVDLEQRITAQGHRLVVMLEGDADPAVDTPAAWQVYVGESAPDHQVRLWAFNVDAATGALSVTDPLTLADVPFDAWRQTLAANPP